MHHYFCIPLPFTKEECRERLLEYCSQSAFACFFDGNNYTRDRYTTFDCIAAFRDKRKQVFSYDKLKPLWHFGFIAYDLKNELENLSSQNPDGLGFPDQLFFVPEILLFLRKNDIQIAYLPGEHDKFTVGEWVKTIFGKRPRSAQQEFKPPRLKPRLTKKEYVRTVNALQRHISRGDIYEINFCQEFFAENARVDPLEIFLRLNQLSRSPFSAFCRFGNNYLISSSPERFLKKTGSQLISQPIKGTARRGKTPAEDKKIKKELRESAKEQAENVMIVDLVRNDLARIAVPGSVKVDELFGIYTFKQVHQMISTVSCQVDKRKDFAAILKATFPMGSMTGAPKVSAMKLIEKYESSRRGLYSGAIGYIDPAGNFDFSVVIRSILYNSSTNYLSFSVGSAITAASDPEKEYEECLLKAKAMMEALR